MKRIHRMLFRLANPGVVIEKGTDLWRRFFDEGEWTVERPTPSSCIATLTGFGMIDALFCENLGFYFQRMFELVGAMDVNVRHPQCRSKGDPHCRYEGEWS